MNQMWRVLQQQSSFMKCFANQVDVPLREIANPAVDQLGAATRGPLRKVARLEQECAVATRRGVNGCAQAGRAPADYHDVPGLAVAETIQALIPCQRIHQATRSDVMSGDSEAPGNCLQLLPGRCIQGDAVAQPLDP